LLIVFVILVDQKNISLKKY